jgi:hypothetical protein
MLSIRLTGTADEVTDAVLTLRDLFPITNVKGLLPTVPRESQVRVHLAIAGASAPRPSGA